MDIYETLPSVLQGLLNMPDLILLVIILVSAILGASRGLVFLLTIPL